jgi:hypothetical protein
MIVGRVDVMKNGKVYGWAFNSDKPSERLQIRIGRGSDILTTGKADVFREDLPDAGVGDGKHAFEVELPPNVTSLQGLVISARSEDSGEVVLPITTSDERHVDDLFEAFAQRYDDVIIEMREELSALRSEGVGRPGGTPIPEDLEARLSKIERRMEDFEVFVVRLDENTRALQERVGLIKPSGFFAKLFRK